MNEILQRRFSLACSQSHAFRVFTEMTDLWWPRGHRRNSDGTLLLQANVGGRLIERAPDGAEWTIGEVLSVDPPHQLEFNWYPGSPNAPTHVTVTFTGSSKSAEIHITHRAVTSDARDAWPDKVTLFERGWDTLLPALNQFVSITPEE